MEPLSFKFAYCEVEVGGIWDTMVSGVLHMHGSSWALGHTLGAEYLDNCFEEISEDEQFESDKAQVVKEIAALEPQARP
ncbi:hypothetical protein RHGRI_029641 [Rhododendron griersonianum]|uniref:Uncharacterized protein n=1 Tax=Rhododendron griersonianum TaxID=479676 RepID=A0AAV6IL46_9ERIC|nr:hypothetical protein RHGRI_029641 [Rhododendron griersonianum]KAG5529038.1 hypothetical protein RHGRI_029641 [Rhododendron griersonianum]